MQFIVDQQAQFWASVQKHDEQIAKNDQQITALTASLQKHDAAIATLTNLVGRLAEAEIRLAEQTQGHEARLASLETKATQLFEHIDRFIRGLEGNGHKPQPS